MTGSTNCATTEYKKLTSTQLKFLCDCKKFGWGKIQVDIKDGEPVGWYPVVIDGVVQQYRKCD